MSVLQVKNIILKIDQNTDYKAKLDVMLLLIGQNFPNRFLYTFDTLSHLQFYMLH